MQAAISGRDTVPTAIEGAGNSPTAGLTSSSSSEDGRNGNGSVGMSARWASKSLGYDELQRVSMRARGVNRMEHSFCCASSPYGKIYLIR